MKYNELDYKDIGKRINTYRKSNNITQQQLADRIDSVPSNISHIERGTTKLSLPTIVKIANALEVSVDQILSGNVKKANNLLKNDIALILEDCTSKETKIMIDILKATKEIIRKNNIS